MNLQDNVNNSLVKILTGYNQPAFGRKNSQLPPLAILTRNHDTQKFSITCHYLQIAFNYDLSMVYSVLPSIPYDDRIIIEAGTPFIKKEGMNGIKAIASLWPGKIVADMKVLDGAEAEVAMAVQAGATAITVAGNAPPETIDIFINACEKNEVASMIDLINVEEPLDVMRSIKKPPKIIILHKGRDEENTRGKVIAYRQVKRIKCKYDVLIAAAGGVNLAMARSVTFNGANIVIANIVQPGDPWSGISSSENVSDLAKQFLDTIG